MRFLARTAAAVTCCITLGGAAPFNQDVIYAFTDLAQILGPRGPFFVDRVGVLYGVGNNIGGTTTIYTLAPPVTAGAPWIYNALYAFAGGADGTAAEPLSARDASGAFYGAQTGGGGSCNCGGLFKLSPPAAGQSAWTKTTIYTFEGPEGESPSGDLVLLADGSLLGTAYRGGHVAGACIDDIERPIGCGTIFRLVPPSAGQSRWHLTVLYYFEGGSDGYYPDGLTLSGRDAVVGEAIYGVATPACSIIGCGNVFRLSTTSAGQPPIFQTLYSFQGGLDGRQPVGGLAVAPDGTLYGSASQGGAASHGAIFQLKPPAAGQGEWQETTIHAFNGHPSDGDYPDGRPVLDRAGNLYSTTERGGTFEQFGCGTVFGLAPPSTGQTQWSEVTLSATCTYGDEPFGGLVMSRGTLFGAQFYGSGSSEGDAFAVRSSSLRP